MGRWVSLAGRVVVLAAVAACGPPPPPGQVSAPPGSAGTISARAVPSPTAGRAYVLGLSVPEPSAEPWASMAHGAQQEASRLGAELAIPKVSGQSGGERQAKQVRELVGRSVDFLLLGAGDDPLVAPALSEAIGRGVPIGGISSLVAVDRVVFKVGPDRYAAGRVQAECLGAALGGRGAVGLLAGPPESLPALERAQGFRETLQRQFPRIQIVVEHPTALGREAAAALVGEWLQQWPGLAGIAAEDEPTALGSLDAVLAAGRRSQTRLAAADLGEPGEQAIRDGSIACATAQQAVAEGRAAVRNAMAYLAGRPYEKNVRSAPALVTPENIGRVDWGAIRAPS